MSIPIIDLLGHARAGKDTAGQWIAEAVGGTTLAFGDKLKSICMEMFNLSREDCYTDEGKTRKAAFERLGCHFCGGSVVFDAEENGWSCAHHGVSDKVRRSHWTNREILQHIGTEGFRAIDPSVWVRFALQEAASRLVCVAITDGRFRSECEGVWAAGGEVWRIRRPGADGAVGIANHQSETEQDSILDSECQVVIENDSTLEVFRERVLVEVQRWQIRQEAGR